MGEKNDLVKAIKTNSWKKVETLLENYPELLNTKLNDSNHLWYHNMSNVTVDTEATENIILKLCTKYKEFVDLERENSAGYTPLRLASFNGKFHQTRAFLKLGSKDIREAITSCCSFSGSNKYNRKRIIALLRSPPPEYLPHTNIHHHFNKLELCEDEPDEPVGDD